MSANLLRDDPQVRAAILNMKKKSPVGAVQANPLVMSAPGLPFDANAASQRDDLVAKLNNTNLGIQQQAQGDIQQGVTDARQLIQNEPGVERSLLNNFAGRGMAFSSGYGYQYGQAKNQLANALSGLVQKHASTLANLRQQKQQAKLETQYLLDRLIQQQTMNAGQGSAKDALSVAAQRSLFGA
jgi:hypothetical protein